MTPLEHGARVFDLGKFAHAIRKRKEYSALVDAIWSALDAHSAQTDLQNAVEAISALKALNAHKLPEIETHAIALALLSNAIILYSRATATKQRARKTFDIRNRMTADQKALHPELYDLRNDAIAHFGTGKSYTGPNWVRETALIYVGPTGSKVGISTRRFSYDPNVVDRLGRQIELSFNIMDTLKTEKAVTCATMINRALKGNSELISLLSSFPFDPMEFLGGHLETEAFYASLYTGHARAFIKGSEQYGEWLPPR